MSATQTIRTSSSNVLLSVDVKPPSAPLKILEKVSFLASTVNSFVCFMDRYLRVCALFMGLVATSLVQPLFISFMVLLWIGDEKFKAYLFPDVNALLSFSLPNSEFFNELLKWSVISTLIGIASITVSVVFFYSSWRDNNHRGVLEFMSSPYFIDQLKQYFVIYYSIWLLVYWFEITVIFFGYIGKLILITVGTHIDLEVNADHNFIGLCFLASFVVLITAADFVIQDVFHWRSVPVARRVECQRQE